MIVAIMVAVAALAPFVLVPPPLVVAIVETLARLDDTSRREQDQAEQQEHRVSNRFGNRHDYSVTAYGCDQISEPGTEETVRRIQMIA
jgi:hypothetical protein